MELLTRMAASIFGDQSGAAATQYAFPSVAGCGYFINEAVAFHDDPAGADLLWRISLPAGAGNFDIQVGATAINVRTRLGTLYSMPLWLPPGWQLLIVASGPLAAGQKFTLLAQYSFIRGLPAGVYS